MAIQNILKKLMSEKEILSGTDLSKATGVPQPTIHRMLTGKTANPSKESIKTLAEFFSVSINQILGKEPLPTDKFSNLFDLTASARVPLISWDKIDNGGFLARESKNPETEWIPVYAKVSQEAFALIAQDSSMEPKFPKGSILIFDSEKEAKDRSYVLALIHEMNQAMFKQVIMDGIARYLKSINPDLEHVVHKMNAKDKIIGVLIQSFINHGD